MSDLVWYVGGNSAGHIVPLRTVGEQCPGHAVFFTTGGDLDKHLMRDFQHTHKTLSCSALPAHWYQIPIFLLRFLRDCLYIVGLLCRERPAYVLSSGGFLALPVVLIARIFRVPCDLFELNVIPGKAVRFLVPWARSIYYCFHEAKNYFPSHKAIWRAYPVRSFTYPMQLHERTRIVLAVLGGSQGSHFLNTCVPQLLETWSPEDRHKIHVIHQTGAHDVAMVLHAYKILGISAQVQSYFDHIHDVYMQADRVICRAGAGTLWELVYYKKPSLVIPLCTQATDHQVANARAICTQYPHCMWFIDQDRVALQHKEIKQWLFMQAPGAQELADPREIAVAQ